ncbi:hypothetical protein MROS_1320 [Melioribacter roseus P3M-2]|uniref:Uncharacterized protein n=1 Tax=Melioribacter roseus (strain DSM 23840 / JCM 17771 / VKM B-2668 / P3M-2) TaxID=1191523 RepID=I6YVH6_MELRP|nr:hypothetical protein [Melioribacter roseus]AFN74557.1 hypothetical protein MROS_1320 [Melioribacter roseus P3M-2]
MRKSIGFLLIFLLPLGANFYSQDLSLCEFIGKSSGEVIKKFGKPKFHDKSNPAMECIFYQNNKARMAFISDKDGVFQIQVDFMYNNKAQADKALGEFLDMCATKSLEVDTLSAADYKITGKGIRMELSMFNNTYTKKYEIKFKAEKTAWN